VILYSLTDGIRMRFISCLISIYYKMHVLSSLYFLHGKPLGKGCKILDFASDMVYTDIAI